ncbi:hypothetical protein ACTXT7_005035 [Hymenolepis weldensis]
MQTPNICAKVPEKSSSLRLSDNYQNTASSAAENTPKDTYGNDIINEKTCRKWFSSGGFKRMTSA